MSAQINVLYIEDDPVDARLVKEELRSPDSKTTIRLEWVDRLEEGLQQLASNHMDVVLLDLDLPDSAGLETLHSVIDRAPSLPVVVMTGRADEAVGVQAVEAGAQDYLVKGQTDGRLLTRSIQYAIQRKQAQKEAADALAFTEHVLSSSPIGILTYKVTGECLSANARAAEMIGATIQELKSQNFRELESWKNSGLSVLAEKAISSGNLTAAELETGEAMCKAVTGIMSPLEDTDTTFNACIPALCSCPNRALERWPRFGKMTRFTPKS